MDLKTNRLPALSRRRLFPIATAAGTALLLDLSPITAQTNDVLDDAIEAAAHDAFELLHAGKPVAHSARRFATLLDVGITRLDTSGATAKIDRAIHSGVSLPAPGALHAHMLKAGVPISNQEFATLYAQILTHSSAGKDAIAHKSARELNQGVAAMFNNWATRFEMLQAALDRAPVFRAQSDFCFYGGWTLWYISIVLIPLDPLLIPLWFSWAAALAGGFMQVTC